MSVVARNARCFIAKPSETWHLRIAVVNCEKCFGPDNVLFAVGFLLERRGLKFSSIIPFLMNEACWPVLDLSLTRAAVGMAA